MMPSIVFFCLSVLITAWPTAANTPVSQNCIESWRDIHNKTAERCRDIPICWQSVYNVLEKKKSYDDCHNCLKYIIEGRSGRRSLQASFFIDRYLCMRKRTNREQRECFGGSEEAQSLRPISDKLLSDFRTSAHDVCNLVSACLPADSLSLQDLTDFRTYFGDYPPDEPLNECWPVIEHYFNGDRTERSRRDADRIPAKCLGGTKIWCSSEEMARRCNRFKYCKWKIWDRDCRPDKKCYKRTKSGTVQT